MRGMERASQRSQAFSVPTPGPALPVAMIKADSATRSAQFTSLSKSKKPGVSSRLILQPFHSTGATAVEIENLRLISSGSKSHTVLPSVIFPTRSVTPAILSRLSTSEVLPSPPCPIRHTLRILLTG